MAADFRWKMSRIKRTTLIQSLPRVSSWNCHGSSMRQVYYSCFTNQRTEASALRGVSDRVETWTQTMVFHWTFKFPRGDWWCGAETWKNNQSWRPKFGSNSSSRGQEGREWRWKPGAELWLALCLGFHCRSEINEWLTGFCDKRPKFRNWLWEIKRLYLCLLPIPCTCHFLCSFHNARDLYHNHQRFNQPRIVRKEKLCSNVKLNG